MKFYLKPIFVAVVLCFVFIALPVELTQAQSATSTGFVTCSGADCTACNLVEMANRLIVWLFGIIFLIFAVLMLVAGFGLVTSAGNQSALEAAKSKFKNGIIGLLIVMSAWLLVNTIMRGLLNGGTGNVSGFGPWSQIQCQIQTVPSRYVPTVSAGNTTFATSTPISIATTTPGGVLSQRIAQAANAMRGMSTAAGPSNGALACAWAVNRVLAQAGIASINGDSVVSMRSVLNGGRGQAVAQSQARAGDLVLVTGASTSGGSSNANHVGICLNDGCTSVISNSSSRRAFSWTSGPTFAPSYVNASPQFYRVTN